MRYGLLISPSANRVYAESSVALTRAELELFGRSALGDRITDTELSTIGGVPYVTFTAELTERDVAYLSNLSSVYALFSFEGELLRPVPLRPLDRYDDDLITIQKYSGKTNEHFTKLLLNVTVLSSAFAGDLLDRRLRVLDPLCGRGTTLNQALMYGFDAAGMDVDGKDVEAYSAFLSTWLKRKRIKHHIDTAPIRRNRQVVARRVHATLAASREDHKAGATQDVEVIGQDTVRAREFFRAGSFDVIVADAPYGVQHGSRTGAALARSPLELLAAAAPVWRELLRPGGAVGIAWNTHVAKREDAAGLLADAGLEPLPLEGFRHRVDQSIARDILTARRPA
ncbi:MAG TPA: SAM-dependent methyltransferase [Mycobacteriales bacterium]|jgi:SAM-dependent methyltransferase|nr:SAM-dependent methyltransferase [Mycobacteriales bacterium]